MSGPRPSPGWRKEGDAMPQDLTAAEAFRLFIFAAVAGLTGLASAGGLLVLWLTRKPAAEDCGRGWGDGPERS